MKKKHICLIALSATICATSASIILKQVNAASEVPPIKFESNLSETYYEDANNLVGDELLEVLAKITYENHKYYTSYDECIGGNALSDIDPNDSTKFIDFYTGWSVPSVWDGGDTWNREHVWCQSLSGGLYGTSIGAGTDIHHIRPLISSINSARNNALYTDSEYCGDIKLEKYYYKGSKLPQYANQFTGCYNNGQNYWEPRNEVKGDIARILMYMFMHYSTEVSYNKINNSYAGNLHINNIAYTDGGLEETSWKMLLKWNELDPVDDFERNRNNYCASVTGTRNPFIDNATYANLIWKDDSSQEGLNPYNELTSKVRTYYNSGLYQNKSNINLSINTINELQKYFNLENIPTLDRTTYFDGNSMIMGDIDGTFKNINSGFGTATEENIDKVIEDVKHSVCIGDMTHYKLNQDGNTVTYDYTIPYSSSFVDYEYEGKGMEAYYVTLQNMSKGYFFKEDWTYDEKIGYYHNVINKSADKFLKDFLEITAPLLLIKSICEDTNYFTIDKLVIKEDDGFLRLQILLDQTNSGFTVDNTNILSEARIYPSNLMFDEKVLEEEKNNSIVFNLGTNGEAKHYDGANNLSSYNEVVDNYTLSITNGSSFYPLARDNKGNSCIKIGKSDAIGSFKFTVPSDINTVVIYVAQYKTNKTIVKINGTSYTITTSSNNGEYTPIEIDTTSNKNVEFETTSSGKRCMINTIVLKK